MSRSRSRGALRCHVTDIHGTADRVWYAPTEADLTAQFWDTHRLGLGTGLELGTATH
jgi:hypothetical protein